jgi:hypothetical protein
VKTPWRSASFGAQRQALSVGNAHERWPGWRRRALASPDPLVRQYACGEIASEIAHQGSTYPATAAAIPWLARLLAHPNADRSTLLGMIRSAGEAALPDVSQIADLEPNHPDRVGIEGTVNAVDAAWPQIWSLFSHASAEDRQCILVCAKCSPSAKPDLVQLARTDADPAMRACAIDSLTSIEGFMPEDVLPALTDPDRLVRTAAAIALGSKLGPGSPSQIVSVLGDTVAHWQEISDRWFRLPYTDGHVLAYAAIAVGSIRSAEAFALASPLCAALNEVDGLSAFTYGQGLLALAFGRGESFAPNFVDILDTIARSPKFFAFNVNASEVLGLWNLPRDERRLRALVEELRAAPDPQARACAALRTLDKSGAQVVEQHRRERFDWRDHSFNAQTCRCELARLGDWLSNLQAVAVVVALLLAGCGTPTANSPQMTREAGRDAIADAGVGSGNAEMAEESDGGSRCPGDNGPAPAFRTFSWERTWGPCPAGQTCIQSMTVDDTCLATYNNQGTVRTAPIASADFSHLGTVLSAAISTLGSDAPCGNPVTDQWEQVRVELPTGSAIAKQIQGCSGTPFDDIRNEVQTLRNLYFP